MRNRSLFVTSTRVAAVCAAAVLGGGLIHGLPPSPTSSISASVHPGTPAVPVRLVAVIDQSSTTIGIADSSLYGLSSTDLSTTLDYIQSLGVTSVRVAIPWASVENREGTYDWTQLDALVDAASARGISIVATVSGTPAWAGNIINGHFEASDYADFVSAVATRYEDKITGYEIWNEPNGALFYNPIDPAAYTEFLKAAYTAIKAVDPDAIVIAGVVGAAVTTGATLDAVTFIQEMYEAGAAGYFDALSYHPYQYYEEYSENDHADSPSNQVAAIRALMEQYGDAALKIWITEYGQPTTGTFTQEQQAAFIQDFIETWQNQEGAGPIYIYTTRDANTGSANTEDNFGLFETDWTAKPAAQVVADLIAKYAAEVGAGNGGDELNAALAAALQEWINAVAAAQLAALQQMFEALAAALGGTSATAAADTATTLAAKVSEATTTTDATTTEATTTESTESTTATTTAASTDTVPSTETATSADVATTTEVTATPEASTDTTTTAPTTEATTTAVTTSEAPTTEATSTASATATDTGSATATATTDSGATATSEATGTDTTSDATATATATKTVATASP